MNRREIYLVGLAAVRRGENATAEESAELAGRSAAIHAAEVIDMADRGMMMQQGRGTSRWSRYLEETT